MFGGFGMWEIVLVFMVILLLFGAKRLPEIGSSLGKGIREFKGSLREIETELKVPEESSARDQQPRRDQQARRDDENNGNGEPQRLTTSQ